MSEYKPISPFYEVISEYKNEAFIGDGFVDVGAQRFTLKDGVVVSEAIAGIYGDQTNRGIENYRLNDKPKPAPAPAVKDVEYINLHAE